MGFPCAGAEASASLRFSECGLLRTHPEPRPCLARIDTPVIRINASGIVERGERRLDLLAQREAYSGSKKRLDIGWIRFCREDPFIQGLIVARSEGQSMAKEEMRHRE